MGVWKKTCTSCDGLKMLPIRAILALTLFPNVSFFIPWDVSIKGLNLFNFVFYRFFFVLMFHFRSLGTHLQTAHIWSYRGEEGKANKAASKGARPQAERAAFLLFTLQREKHSWFCAHSPLKYLEYLILIRLIPPALCAFITLSWLGAGESPQSQTFSGIFQRKTSRTSIWITRLIGSDGFLNLLRWLLGGSHCFNSLPWLLFIPFFLLYFVLCPSRGCCPSRGLPALLYCCFSLMTGLSSFFCQCCL